MGTPSTTLALRGETKPHRQARLEERVVDVSAGGQRKVYGVHPTNERNIVETIAKF